MTVVTSRRAMLVGAAAIPALSIPVAALPQTNRDAGLLALGDKLEAAWKTLKAHEHGPQKEAEDRYEALVPRGDFWAPTKMPRKLARQIPWFGAPGTKREHLTVGEYAILKKFVPKHPVVLWQDEQLKKLDAARREDAKERKRIARIAEECGVQEAEDEFNRLSEVCWDIFRDVLKTPAYTVAGMEVKMRSLKYVAMEDDIAEEGPATDFWQSLRADVERIAEKIA